MAAELIAAFFAAALSGMGVGGGGLLLLYLVLACGVGQREAQLYNLVFFVAASSASLIIHSLRRRINIAVVIILGAGGAAGSFLGCRLASAAGDGALRCIFGAFLVISGLISLISGIRGSGGAAKRRRVSSGRSEM